MRDWREALMARHPDLFAIEDIGGAWRPGYPDVGDGWRDLVELALTRIAGAAATQPPGALRVVQIKEKFGTLRLYLDFPVPSAVAARVTEAVELAEARSACTCETCGAVGRLWSFDGYLHTACDRHGRGRPVPVRPGREYLRIEWRIGEDGAWKQRVRRYDRDRDAFVEVPPPHPREDDR